MLFRSINSDNLRNPLALYIFSKDRKMIDKVTSLVQSGGVVEIGRASWRERVFRRVLFRSINSDNLRNPLALYIFSKDRKMIDKVTSLVQSGGVVVNDTIFHVMNPYTPFGGVGGSGTGAYHGKCSATPFFCCTFFSLFLVIFFC